MHETLGTRIEFSTAFHLKSDGQTERVNHILEDMLRACALDYGSRDLVGMIICLTQNSRTTAATRLV